MFGRVMRDLVYVAVLALGAVPVALAEDPAPPANPPRKAQKGLEGVLQRMTEVGVILNHQAELSLTPGQVTQFTALRDKIETASDKLKTDEEFQALFAKLQSDRKGDDRTDVKDLRQQLVEMIDQKTGLSMKAVRAQINRVLTADQLDKLQQLLAAAKNGKGAGGDGGQGKGKRAAPAPDAGGLPQYGG